VHQAAKSHQSEVYGRQVAGLRPTLGEAWAARAVALSGSRVRARERADPLTRRLQIGLAGIRGGKSIPWSRIGAAKGSIVSIWSFCRRGHSTATADE
jgi:hypothetical protein